MANIKVHELAKELGKTSRDVIEYLQKKGVEVKSVQSSLEDNVAGMVRKDLGNSKEEKAPVQNGAEAEAPKKKKKIIIVSNQQNSNIPGQRGPQGQGGRPVGRGNYSTQTGYSGQGGYSSGQGGTRPERANRPEREGTRSERGAQKSKPAPVAPVRPIKPLTPPSPTPSVQMSSPRPQATKPRPEKAAGRSQEIPEVKPEEKAIQTPAEERQTAVGQQPAAEQRMAERVDQQGAVNQAESQVNVPRTEETGTQTQNAALENSPAQKEHTVKTGVSDGRTPERDRSGSRSVDGREREKRTGDRTDREGGRTADGRDRDRRSSDRENRGREIRTADGRDRESRFADGRSRDSRPADGRNRDGRPVDGRSRDGRPAEESATDATGRTVSRPENAVWGQDSSSQEEEQAMADRPTTERMELQDLLEQGWKAVRVIAAAAAALKALAVAMQMLSATAEAMQGREINSGVKTQLAALRRKLRPRTSKRSVSRTRGVSARRGISAPEKS